MVQPMTTQEQINFLMAFARNSGDKAIIIAAGNCPACLATLTARREKEARSAARNGGSAGNDGEGRESTDVPASEVPGEVDIREELTGEEEKQNMVGEKKA